MSVEISGLSFAIIAVAIGLAIMGYFIGNGLKNIGKHDDAHPAYNLIRQEDLSMYLSLNPAEIDDLLKKYPDAPRLTLNGTTYYPYKQFVTWLAAIKD